METQFKRVCIIGIGLIGGSLGMAITERRLAAEVRGVDLDEDNLNLAVNVGAIQFGTRSLAEGVKGADLVILATPVGTYPSIFKQLAQLLEPGTVVTDTGSTKERVISEAAEHLPTGIHFVGGHPMAGSEVAGVKGADPFLFENAVYLLTPTEDSDRETISRLNRLFSGLGARVMCFSPAEHDIMVAAVSHLPHLVAVTLVNTVGLLEQNHPNTLLLAAGGFRDTTRVALGSPVMWRDICKSNKAVLLDLLNRFKTQLSLLEEEIRQEDGEAITTELESARALRSQVPGKLKGYWPELYEIIVT
ncbi:MAG TPA: prephenate dehydrogenase/arogenate dehydrogenase family protein, partial [Bacillota bacterium]|nr:prephenate dehydrogenase/arogenate dehydrogenase family protein [Bacillota bacterium]